MNILLGIIISLFVLFNISFAQTYQGPAVGSVPSGGTVSTGSFSKASEIGAPKERGTRNVISPYKESFTIDFGSNAAPFQSYYVEDKNVRQRSTEDTSMTILLKNFKGLSMGNSIPPDPHLAVGPNHIIATVNVSFAIWDKEGNLLKVINPDAWFSSLVSNPDCFDPQILYDHFDKRWIMSWDSENRAAQKAYFMVAVSDDSIPLGTWYIWALPANKNGNTVVSNWGDYPQLGFNKDAIFINSRQFTMTNPSSYQYNKIRIIKKSDIYNNPGGALSWTDIWDITDPQVASTYKPDVIIPAINYDNTEEQFFLHAPRWGGNFISLYKITNATTTPVLTRTNLFVANYGYAPDADQKGGSTVLISSNESGMKTQPIVRDGFMWGVHSIANPTSAQYAALRYYKINLNSPSVTESGTLGALNYWYIFPTLTVDKDQNIAITYSRSGIEEYCGAFYTTRLKNDPPGLSGSYPLKEGQGNYVVTFGGSRNRWGDYTGIYLDPSDQNNIWMHTEFAEATNRWGTWIGKTRMVPFSGTYVNLSADSLDFGELEVGFTSDTLSLEIRNLGSDTLIINNIPANSGPFQLVSNLSFPVRISTYASETIKFSFNPTSAGNYNLIYPISTNNPEFTGIKLKGLGYQILSAVDNTIYASTGSGNSGNMVTLNPATGAGTNLGSSLFSEITDIAIHPKTNFIYGINASGFNSRILRVNALEGDAHTYFNLNLPEPKSIAFDTSGTLYALLKNGRIYTIDLMTQTTNLVLDTNFTLASIAFNPLTNELWATTSSLFVNRDRVMKVDLTIPDTTIIGKTGLNVVTNNIAFDGSGILYGVTGSSSAINNLIKIDTATAAGTIVGATGIKHITGIDLTSNSLTSVKQNNLANLIPSEFILKQNYPNPFNPMTVIEFALPVNSRITLKVYNLLGQTVKVLYDGVKPAGSYKTNWNADDYNGNKVSSGIYFYELKATGFDGREFNQMRKMILIK